MPLRWEFDKGQSYRKTLKGYKKSLQDLRWAWPVVARAVEKVQARNFDEEGRLSDGGWIPLSPATAKARFFGWDIEGSVTGAYSSPSSEQADGRILHWTHTLRNSLTKGNAQYAVRTMQRTAMIFGTSAPHAQELDKGRSRNIEGKQMPPRPVLAVEASRGPITRAMEKALEAKFKYQVRRLP